MKRAKHNLSHFKDFSCNLGNLVPVGCVEVLPGDTFKHDTSAFMRFAPLNTPVMHPCHVTIHHWFVPTRLLWSNWENFITGGPDGDDASVYPTIEAPTTTGFAEGSLADYFGIPTGVDGFDVSALPFRAYAKIYNEFYRDEQLINPLTVSLADGVDSTTSLTMQNVAWEKDYFTSARPEPQLGPDVYLPLGTSAPVNLVDGSTDSPLFRKASDQTLLDNVSLVSTPTTAAIRSNTAVAGQIDPNGTLEADLSVATAATINQLRQASAIQRFMERMNRYGSRYSEYLLGLGIKSSDARLQRPEYLGGGSQTVQFSEVLQTAEGTDPVGTLRGHGIAAMKSNRYTRFFEEHGYVITVMYVKPKTMYVQGINRMWSRRTKYDFWQKELQHIGQQEVLNKEVYVDGTANDEGVFGYQDRYDEYRRIFSSIAGEMRSTLDTWHMARIFASRPSLNADFINSNPTDRIFASSTNDVLQVMTKHNLYARRLVAKRGFSTLS
jgi:hypothetical protein